MIENQLICEPIRKRQSRYLDLRTDQPNGALVPCSNCGRVRVYTKYDVARKRVSELCQPCAVRKFAAQKPKRTKEQKKAAIAAWYQRNKAKSAKYYSQYRENIRLEMVAAYGGKCQECNEADPIVLVLDHINDDGPLDRKQNNHNGGYKMYLYLRQNGWPKGQHQLVCHNCNFRKEYKRRKNAVLNR